MCIIITLIFEMTVLFFLDKYLNDTASYKSKLIEEKFSLEIPINAQNIDMSSDGKYLSYYFNKEIYIWDTENNTCTKFELEKENQLEYYKWIPHRNRIILIEKQNEGDINNLSLSYYDIDKQEKQNIKQFATVSKESYVEDIELSTLTNIIYIKVVHIGARNSIYRVDIAQEIIQIKTQHYFIGNIEILQHEDKLIYEDSSYNRIYISNYILRYLKEIKIENVDKLVLLKVDNEDNIYLGKVNNKKITEIYYGKYDIETYKWDSIILKEPINKDDIIFNNDGYLFIINRDSRTIFDSNNKIEFKYEGKLLKISDSGYIYLDKLKVTKDKIK